MGENSSIEWTHHTFNPWWGCTRVSVGPKGACVNCYADTWAHRLGMELWDNGRYRTFGAKHWSEPLAWNKAAALSGDRPRVFCASMADVFDKDAPAEERQRLWRLIEATPHLDWLLLTKRVGNVLRMIPPTWLRLPENVWLGISVVTQEEVDRDVPKLLEIPASVRFLSCEPLMEAITFEGRWIKHDNPAIHENWLEVIDWVIVGGESGPHSRPMNPAWATSLRDQCQAVATPFFFKQHGEWIDWRQAGANVWSNTTRGNKGPCRGQLHRGETALFGGASLETIHTAGQDAAVFCRVGKKAAGRLLDGRTWDQFPNASDSQHSGSTSTANEGHK